MVAKDFLVSFLEFNFWADEHVLQQVEQLTSDQLHAMTKMSHHTAFDLTRHMLDTEWNWRLLARGGIGEKKLWEVEDVPDLPAMRRFWKAERDRMLDYVNSLSKADLDKVVDFGTAQGGQPKFSKVWQILLHVVNHSTHHRSELSHYLEDCGHPVAEQYLDFAGFIQRNGSEKIA